jgi:hypothetical protein
MMNYFSPGYKPTTKDWSETYGATNTMSFKLEHELPLRSFLLNHYPRTDWRMTRVDYDSRHFRLSGSKATVNIAHAFVSGQYEGRKDPANERTRV